MRYLESQIFRLPCCEGSLTLGFTCGRKPERGTSGGWRPSGASPCWALVLASAVALPPRRPPPTTTRRTPSPRLGSPPPPWPVLSATALLQPYAGQGPEPGQAGAGRHPHPQPGEAPPALGRPHLGGRWASPSASACRAASHAPRVALPAMRARLPRRGEPSRVGRAPSRVEAGSPSWQDALPGGAGALGLGGGLWLFPPTP
jgi:hypothetical protein